MVLTAILFFVLSFITYFLLAWFGQLTGGGPGDFWADVRSVFAPVPLAILLFSNFLFAASLSIGFKITPFAIPMAVAIGVVASFVYSLLFLGGVVTWMKILGVAAILVGVYLLR